LASAPAASDLAEKWTITYLGTETIDGIKTDKLELVAKDPEVSKNIPKVTIWLDTARAVSLKQVFDEGEGQSAYAFTPTSRSISPCPRDAFSFDSANNGAVQPES
jgi:hypothetical protein